MSKNKKINLCNNCQESALVEERYNKILRHSYDEIYIFDANTLRLKDVSQGALTNLGYTIEEIRQMTPLDIKPMISKVDFDHSIRPLITGVEPALSFQTAHQRKDGSLYDVDVRLQYIGGEEPELIAVVEDITERLRYEEELKDLAFRDPGTELYNKRFFNEQLILTADDANRRGSTVGLIMIDIDDFSDVNNSYGHVAGDKIINDIAKKVKKIFSRKSDVVARYGGDEFVVLCTNNQKQHLLHKCRDLIDLLNKPCYYKDCKISPTASIGIAVCDGNSETIIPEQLIARADSAMYAAKAAGKHTVRIFQ